MKTEREIGSMKTKLPSTQVVFITRIYLFSSESARNSGLDPKNRLG